MTKNATTKKKNRSHKATRRKSSEGSVASLVAAGGSILVLVGLLYASFRGDRQTPHAEPQAAQATQTASPPPVVTTAANVPAAAPVPAAPAPNKAQAEDWNEKGIAWQTYDAGMSQSKRDNKPVCLVFFTNWCPHCRNYSKVFSDPRVVAKAKDFVMIRLNADDVPDISNAHSPDGTYVPRTFFLGTDGKILADVHAPRPQYMHFYDEHNPESLLAGMEAAIKKIRAM